MVIFKKPKHLAHEEEAFTNAFFSIVHENIIYLEVLTLTFHLLHPSHTRLLATRELLLQ